MEIEVPEQYCGQRVDIALSTLLGHSRQHVQKLIREGLILVEGKTVKPSYLLKGRERVTAVLPPEEKSLLEPEDIPVEILYEDDFIAVVNKPSGLAVHPGAGRKASTLVNALLAHFSLPQKGGDVRPGIVHRLDKDTSGLIVVAKNEHSLMELSRQFRERTVEKTYLALVHGTIAEEEGLIEVPIGRDPKNRVKFAPSLKGKRALTEFLVLKRYRDYTLLKLKPVTGRTHQIRVHLSFIGHPVVGDPVYGWPNPWRKVGQLLHAYSLVFIHPVTGKTLRFEAPLPQDFQAILEGLDKLPDIGRF